MPYNKAKLADLGKLVYRDADHKYTFSSFRVPSVTQTLEPLMNFDGMPQKVREDALLRGTLVHKLTESWDRGKPLDLELIDDAQLGGYLRSYQKLRDDFRFEIVSIEERLYHRKHRFAGTSDRLVIHDGDLGVLELKSGPLHPEYALQTAGYQLAANDGRVGQKVTRRWAVFLKQDGNYSLVEHKDKEDEDAFVGALRLAYWRMRRAA